MSAHLFISTYLIRNLSKELLSMSTEEEIVGFTIENKYFQFLSFSNTILNRQTKSQSL